MIVPQYWAEARQQHRAAGKQITVRRFGWSDASQGEAQAHAEQRAGEALSQVLAGAKLARRDSSAVSDAGWSGGTGFGAHPSSAGRSSAWRDRR
jgi:hypothetical protein